MRSSPGHWPVRQSELSCGRYGDIVMDTIRSGLAVIYDLCDQAEYLYEASGCLGHEHGVGDAILFSMGRSLILLRVDLCSRVVEQLRVDDMFWLENCALHFQCLAEVFSNWIPVGVHELSGFCFLF